MTVTSTPQRARIPGPAVSPETLATLRALAARAGVDPDRGASRWFGVAAAELSQSEAESLLEATRARLDTTPGTSPAREGDAPAPTTPTDARVREAHRRIPRRPGPTASEGQRRCVAALMRDGAVDVADWLARLGCQLHEMTRPEAGELIDTCRLVGRHEELI